MDRLLAAAREAYDDREAAAVARFIAERIFGLSRVDLALEPDREVALPSHPDFSHPDFSHPDPVLKPSFDRLLADLSAAKPVQYIVGEADFCGLQLAVGQGVLIPRPETEELVRWILDYIGSSSILSSCADFGMTDTLPAASPFVHYDGLSILDVGTGSGAIAVALAKSLPGARVTAIDVSEEALVFARQNNLRHTADVKILRADVFDFSPSERFDIIVSNPPYIPDNEQVAMHWNVLGYEPATALFVPDDDPLRFYRAIARLAGRALKPKGALFFEIHPPLAAELGTLLRSEGFSEVVVREDIFGQKRVVKAGRKL